MFQKLCFGLQVKMKNCDCSSPTTDTKECSISATREVYLKNVVFVFVFVISRSS